MKRKIPMQVIITTAVMEALNPPTDWWQKALQNRHLTAKDHKRLAEIDAEHERRKNVCRFNPSTQRCGYVREGEEPPRHSPRWRN